MASDRPTKDPTPPDGNGGDEPISNEAFVAMHSDPRFTELKRRLYRFIFPMSIAFMAWYLLYVLMSAFGRDIMGTNLFGSVNVALVFGLLQFVSTFGIAVLYTRYANRNFDRSAAELRDELQNGATTQKREDNR
ncbi:clumping factor B [Nocardiopsis terrae]|uniref:Uncharacterized membrane protein (DUF485 family) n=1 Tax=Nocardiopsis terrae TaxID=372655 RepID=A0ABR9HB97_9ACTN|nr:DUF485 domain-containing protein [Nocardiopsis terrae]MBE1456283.1 uncharacterized membrane protein (DUF485 family) [Nocardiopsis terrae]GHC77726.1 clumping factor B [Nocardiopsis terrae]